MRPDVTRPKPLGSWDPLLLSPPVEFRSAPPNGVDMMLARASDDGVFEPLELRGFDVGEDLTLGERRSDGAAFIPALLVCVMREV